MCFTHSALCLLTGKMRNRQVIDAAFRRAGAKADVILETDSIFSLYAHVSEAGLYSIVPHSLLNFFDMAKVQARPLTPRDRICWSCWTSPSPRPRVCGVSASTRTSSYATSRSRTTPSSALRRTRSGSDAEPFSCRNKASIACWAAAISFVRPTIVISSLTS